MAKQIKTRLQNKTDTSANWTTAGNNGFIPLKGEMIVYLNDGFKIGDGTTNINNLPMYRNANAISSITVAANASDDDVVILTGTGGTNAVTYSASHANSGVTAGTYRSVTVNAKGHVTGGTNPTTLAGYGITDALASNTKYALSDTVGGNALKANTVSIVGRVTSSNTIFQVAAAVAVRTEEIWFGGSDGVAGGMPASYCITVVKKGDNHRTILDCYHLSTGDHYINGCMNTNDVANSPWTGWVKQPNASDLNQVLIDAKEYTDSKAITVDSALSTTSKNAVENQAITNWLASNVKQYYLDFNGSSQGYISLSDSATNPAAGGPSGTDVAYSIETTAGNIQFGVYWENVASVPTATIHSPGIVQLADSVSSTSTATAATPNSVKQAYDLAVKANEKVPLIPVTYSELVELRNNEQLVPGMFYRIIDYQCTTVQENTKAMNNKFDIIVQALSSNMLSENASADYCRSGGTVISSSVIESSGVLIENSVTPYYYEYIDHAAFDNDVVLQEYKSIDVFIAYNYLKNNEGVIVPVLYKTDLKGVQNSPDEYDYPDYADAFYYIGTSVIDGVVYDKWRKINSNDNLTWDSTGKIYLYTNVVVESSEDGLVDTIVGIKPDAANLSAWELKYCLDNDTSHFAWADEENGKGVIYYMKDEWGNECPYDFKNIQFLRSSSWQNEHSDFIESLGININDVQWFYTFSWINEELYVEDATIIQGLKNSGLNLDGLYRDNIISSYTNEYDKKELPNNIFISSFQYDGYFYGSSSNILAIDCYFNTFGNECYRNILYSNCYNNIFSAWCYNNILKYFCNTNTFNRGCGDNIFGDHCYSNTFGDNCNYNIFDTDCHSNTFDNACNNNTFGSQCSGNIFSDNNAHNTFNSYCDNNEFGTACLSNIFGHGCTDNKFNNSCVRNVLGIECTNIALGTSCCDNTFDNYCDSNTLGNDCNDNKFGFGCSGNDSDYNFCHNTFGNNCLNNSFDYDCCYNTFGGECSDNIFEYACTENIFKSQCSNNTFRNTCERNKLNNYCRKNNFGYGCRGNILEPQCLNNTFKNNCDNNYIAQDSRTNIFNDHCNSNILGTFCIDNVLGKNCDSNSFGHYCSNIIFGTSQSNTIGYIQNTNFASYCQYIHLINAEVGSTTNVSRNTSILQGVTGTESAPLELEIYRNSTPIVYEANNTKHIILDI